MGHWYTQGAEPMHWVESANGNMRDTTLRDARKLNLLPSVTEIINILDKPALTRWKLKQVTKAAWIFGDSEDYTSDEYHSEIMANAFESSTDARDRGSEIHDALEQLFKEGGALHSEYSDGVVEIAKEAANQIMEYTGCREFTPEQTVTGNGYGGMIDAHNGDFVIDWKTKDIDDPTKKMAWDEQAMQLAAYAMALDRSFGKSSLERRCINVFIDRTEPGKVVIHEWSQEDIEHAWKQFKLLVQLWQLSKKYYPGEL